MVLTLGVTGMGVFYKPDSSRNKFGGKGVEVVEDQDLKLNIDREGGSPNGANGRLGYYGQRKMRREERT